MPTIPYVRCLTLALGVCCTIRAVSGQLTIARRSLVANPSRSVAIGQSVILSVHGATQGASYRYVAALSAATFVDKTTGSRCATPQTIGSGGSVVWRPSGGGTYSLVAYGPIPSATDTLRLTYGVTAGTVMLASAQTQTSSGTSLMLRTDDLGPGHTYEWSMRLEFKPMPTGGAMAPPHPPISWTAQTTSPMATYPTPIPPPQSITASVEVHAGDPCAIVAAGAMQRTY